MTVAAILKHKGHDVAQAAPGQSVAEVVRLLTRRRIGAVPVVEEGAVLGMLSERDVMYALATHGPVALEMTAAELMTSLVHTVTRTTTVMQAMRMMTDGRVRHLPVVEDGRLLGLVSIGDVVKARMMQQEAEVDSLKAYVVGTA